MTQLIEEKKEKKKEKEKVEKEKEKDKEKGFAIIDGKYYEATSPDMLQLPFLSVTKDTISSLLTRYSQYIQQKLAEHKRKNLRASASNLDEEDDKDKNCPIPDSVNKF